MSMESGALSIIYVYLRRILDQDEEKPMPFERKELPYSIQ